MSPTDPHWPYWFAPAPLRTREDVPGQRLIEDLGGRGWLSFTPEEWVRQHLIYALIHTGGYPKGLISVERGVPTGRARGRYDLIVFDRQGAPYLLAECKAPGYLRPTRDWLQLQRYLGTSRPLYLLLTDGLTLHLRQAQDGSGEYRDGLIDSQRAEGTSTLPPPPGP